MRKCETSQNPPNFIFLRGRKKRLRNYKFLSKHKTLHFKGKKCVLQASIEFKLQIRSKNICFDAAKVAKGCNSTFIIYH